MELKWLEDFVMLANTASFSRAAQARNVTQSAFSRRIKQLENWLGVTLISRASLPAALTPEGRAFLPVAQETIRTFHSVRATLAASAAPRERQLTFAALHTLTVTMLPDWLTSVKAALPDLVTTLLPDRGGIEANVDALLSGDVDLFLTYAHPLVPVLLDPEQFDWLHLGEETVLPVTAPRLLPSVAQGRGLCGPEPGGLGLLDAAIEQGTAVPYLDYGLASFFGTALQQIFFEKKPFQRRNMHQNTISAELRIFALKGWGLCWLPESLIREDLEQGTLVRASADPGWDLKTEIRLYRSRNHEKRVIDELWSVAKKVGNPARSPAAHTNGRA
ncbi:LysR family transcriptional regulator [Breoghania sp. JC706]|uniref:LysR family transcriptional regulator n=1 Tax=Breoghania sp. JC706 TaxID=3117732 RepID=UPI0030087CE0